MMWYLHICSSVWVLPLKQKWTQQKHLHWYLIVSHTHGAPKHTYNTACSHVYMYECEWERAHPETSYTHTKSINVCMLACTHTHTHTRPQSHQTAATKHYKWSNSVPRCSTRLLIKSSSSACRSFMSKAVTQARTSVSSCKAEADIGHCNITPMEQQAL